MFFFFLFFPSLSLSLLNGQFMFVLLVITSTLQALLYDCKLNKKYNCSGHKSNQKVMHHYQHSKISSINQFVLNTHQILGSHELKPIVIFDHAHPKIIKSTFSFPEFVPACKNKFIQSVHFLRYSQF